MGSKLGTISMFASHSKISLPTPVALVGLGLSNRAVEKLLLQLGYRTDQICYFDDKLSDSVVSDPELLKQKGVRTLVVSPGYPLSKSWIAEMRQKGVELTSELAIAGSLLENEKLIGITGSLGKSTTTSLIGVGLQAAGIEVFVGGNLGIPLATYVSEVLAGQRKRATWLVLELSSFQLENLGSLKFDYSLFTYLCPNHLERYESLKHYYDTKATLADRTKHGVWANAQSADLKNYFSTSSRVQWADLKTQSLFSAHDWQRKKLVGTHNEENIYMVSLLLQELGFWNTKSKEALLNFKGLPHRMELVSDKGPVFINDSKATTMESVSSAVKSVFHESRFKDGGGALWVLLGGRDKKLPWGELQSLSTLEEASRLKFVFFGECRETAATLSRLPGLQLETLAATMKELRRRVEPRDWVLLSPGGTSLDEFKNFEDRGEHFSAWAKELWNL
jgi:UDP-N-acetylmuramoylalanine--D-glutamate ligase